MVSNCTALSRVQERRNSRTGGVGGGLRASWEVERERPAQNEHPGRVSSDACHVFTRTRGCGYSRYSCVGLWQTDKLNRIMFSQIMYEISVIFPSRYCVVCLGRVDATSQRRDTNTLGANSDDARSVRSVGSVRARAIVIRHALCAFNASITRLLRQAVRRTHLMAVI